MQKENVLHQKSYAFAIRTVKLNQYLTLQKKEYTLSKQVLRSGTAIGALVSESQFAQSKPDFINKLSISLKEANETHYWINLLKDTDYIDMKMFESLEKDINELLKLLTSIINTMKSSQ
ncbi:MAG: four helix bundle protein [Campylobacterota bacterium]|nr:four helix bundle protein [Campylobacterota bacterium]